MSGAAHQILAADPNLSVFVTALTFRHAHRSHDFHRDMHDVTEQVERLAMMVLLLLFGGGARDGLGSCCHLERRSTLAGGLAL